MRILVWHDKYGDFYYPATTREELHKSALLIVQERKEKGYFYDDSESESDAILDAHDGEAALNFLHERDDDGYEYEGISLASMIDITKLDMLGPLPDPDMNETDMPLPIPTNHNKDVNEL